MLHRRRTEGSQPPPWQGFLPELFAAILVRAVSTFFQSEELLNAEIV
jgi:hypothetical protein